VNAGGVDADIVHDDQRPIAERNVLEFGEGVDGGGDFPHRRQVAAGLFLQRVRDLLEVVHRRARGL
jgi:hypothetical protein